MNIRLILVVGVTTVLALAGCVDGSEPSADRPALESRFVAFATEPAASVVGNVVVLHLATTGIDIMQPDGDMSGATGHLHVFIDREPPPPGEYIPREEGIVHTTHRTVALAGLAVGRHRFAVVAGDGAHRRLDGAPLRAEVMVEGPSLSLAAPAFVPSGEPVPIDLRLISAPLTGATDAHVHLFIDRDPSDPIPTGNDILHTTQTSLSLTGLPSGHHTVWAVLGDAGYVPFSPLVMAKVDFFIGYPSNPLVLEQA